MRKHAVIAALEHQADAIRALGATSLYLFGSTARDAATAESDIDLFVEYDQDGRFSLVELVGIKQLLERHLEIPVDLTTRDGLDPLPRDEIEATAERIL